MGLLPPPEQPIAGYCAAGRNNPLLFLYSHNKKKDPDDTRQSL